MWDENVVIYIHFSILCFYQFFTRSLLFTQKGQNDQGFSKGFEYWILVKKIRVPSTGYFEKTLINQITCIQVGSMVPKRFEQRCYSYQTYLIETILLITEALFSGNSEIPVGLNPSEWVLGGLLRGLAKLLIRGEPQNGIVLIREGRRVEVARSRLKVPLIVNVVGSLEGKISSYFIINYYEQECKRHFNT